MSMYIYADVCKYLNIYIYMCACMDGWMHAWMHTCMHAYIHT